MNRRIITSWIAAGAGALVVVGVSWVPLAPTAPRQPRTTAAEISEVRALFTRLESECQPDSPGNDYEWSSNAPPTERHRREILEQLHAFRPAALAEARALLQEHKAQDEFSEMLIVVAAALGDQSKVVPAAKLLAYSRHPAVRLSAAREFRKMRDPRTIEWLEVAANTDERRVRNDGCGQTADLYYPVRTAAVLALRDMGIEFDMPDDLRRERLEWQREIQEIMQLEQEKRRKEIEDLVRRKREGRN